MSGKVEIVKLYHKCDYIGWQVHKPKEGLYDESYFLKQGDKYWYLGDTWYVDELEDDEEGIQHLLHQ